MMIFNARMGAACVALGMVWNTACTQKTLEDEWEYTLEQADNAPLELVDFLPRPGTPGIPPHIQPYFFFNKAIGSDLTFALSQVGVDASYPFDVQMDGDGLGVRFLPGEDVKASSDSGLTVMSLLNGDEAVVSDSPFFLRHGEGSYFNASIELACTRFGADPDHASQLNTYMEPGVYPLYMFFAEGLNSSVSFPTTLDLYLGPAYFRDNGQVRVYRHVGYSTPMPEVAIAADGSFTFRDKGTFFPFDTPDGVLLLYLEDVVIKGRFSNDGPNPELLDLTVAGVFPTRFLRILADSSTGYSLAVSILELDVDLNGNGIPDSATFAIKSTPGYLPEGDYAL